MAEIIIHLFPPELKLKFIIILKAYNLKLTRSQEKFNNVWDFIENIKRYSIHI